MSDSFRKKLITAAALLAAFFLFTLLVRTVDVKPVGPENSEVGFSALNTKLFTLMGGYHSFFETLTKLLGYAALLIIGAFGALGLSQLLKARSLRGVDPQIILLGVFYIVVLACYFLFEKLVVNYRPVILEEGLEVSYPSSHTVMVIAVMATLPSQLKYLVRNDGLSVLVKTGCSAIIAVMVAGRLLSGVHWFTDIVGGILLAVALVMFYFAALDRLESGNAGGGKKNSARGGAHLAVKE